MIDFILESSLCWLLFLSFYYLFLSRSSNLIFNRVYLLTTLVLGLVIPYISGFLYWNSSAAMKNDAVTQLFLVDSEVAAVAITSHSIDWMWGFILGIYAFGALIKLIKLFYGLYKIKTFEMNGMRENLDNCDLVITKKPHLPFSFFNSIYINQNFLNNPRIEQVLIHEKVHCHHGHSIDILLLEFLGCLLWFNPLLWLYKVWLKSNHEFTADYFASKSSIENYKSTLKSTILENYQLQLVNSFFNNKIKSRIMSLESKKKNSLVRYFGLLPIIAFLCLYLSQNNHAPSKIDPSEINQEIYDLRSECHELDISLALEKFRNYYKEKLANVDIKDISLLQKTINLQGVENGMRITFLNEKEFADLQFVVPFESLKEYQEGNSSEFYDEMILGNTVTDRMNKRMMDDNPDNDPLIVIDGDWATITDYMKIAKAKQSTHLPEKTAMNKYGEKGKFGAIELIGVEMREESSHEEIDEMPRFPGCEDVMDKKERHECASLKMIQFVYKQITYPEEAKKKGIEGTNIVKFIVETDGSLSNIGLVKDIGHGTGEQSVKAVEIMNEQNIRWIPGVKDGKKVKVEFKLPIKFKLTDDSKNKK